MAHYKVKWITDIFDDEDDLSPEEIAQKALSHIQDTESIAHVFTVQNKETKQTWSVDLDEEEEDRVLDIEPNEF